MGSGIAQVKDAAQKLQSTFKYELWTLCLTIHQAYKMSYFQTLKLNWIYSTLNI